MTVNAADTSLGFAHFIAQADGVAKTLLAILLLMSVLSWAIIALKGLSLVTRRRRSQTFLNFFWNATSLDAVAGEIATHGAHDPFSHLTSHAMHAHAHHARYGAAKLEEAGSSGEFVTRTIKKVLDEEMTRLENGLTVLATVGATGTVTVSSDTVTVTVTASQNTQLLGLAGISSLSVHGTGSAQPQTDVATRP